MGVFGLGKHTLGSGVSGSVSLVKDGKLCYVVKTYHKKEKFETRQEYHARVTHEHRILQQLDHPNIIRLIKVVSSFSLVSLRLEAGQSENLYRQIRTAPHTKDVFAAHLAWWCQICSAIEYLHERGFCHRDLKLENVVLSLDGKTVKIVDWVTAARCFDDENRPICATGLAGSPKYAAPETASSILYAGRPVDVWSLGVMFYFIATRTFPWRQAIHSDKAFAQFCSDGPDAVLATVEENWHKLLTGLLEIDPEKRLKALLILPFLRPAVAADARGLKATHPA